MAATAIFDFWNREILLAILVEHAKFRQNRSVGCKDIKIFFYFSRWRPAPSWILEIVNFYLLTLSGGPRRITVPNFVKIGRSVADILRFFEFSRCPLPPSWIFEIAKFYWLLGSKFCQNRSIGCEDIKIFRFFKMAAVAILDFRNRVLLIPGGIWRSQVHHCTKNCRNRRFFAEILRFLEF